MENKQYIVDFMVDVKVTINDPDVIDRCVNNHDDQGIPQSDQRGSSGWRNMFYDLREKEEVIKHLAHNCLYNGITRANRLDGWADCDDDAATMEIFDIDSGGLLEYN
jgi:hypothetical protein